MAARKPNFSLPVSAWALIGSNLIPLIGAVFFSWNVFNILLLYWLENFVVGFFNMLRMRKAAKGSQETTGPTVSFFVAHYGFFMLGHLLFILLFANTMGAGNLWVLAANSMVGLPFLIFSHYTSYVSNYIGKGEYKLATAKKLMGRPYPRLVVMHITIVFGSFPAMNLKNPVWFIVVLILLKTGIDLWFHMKEHAAKTANNL